MHNQQLLDYIKQQMGQGVDAGTIRTNLINQGGWTPSDVEQAFFQISGAAQVPSNPNIPRATTSPITTSPAASIQPVKYAGFWIRWVAKAVDGLILIIPALIVQFFIPSEISWVMGFIVTWVYFVWLTNSNAATLGKMLVGIKVSSVDGQKLSFGKVLLRETVGKLISIIILGIGYIMAAFTEKKQGLHDFMAGSVVVYKDPSKPHHAGLVVGIIIAIVLPIIAIFGILSSVVLVSLNSARNTGRDLQVVSGVQQVRAILESDMDFETFTYPDLGNNTILTSGPGGSSISQFLSDAIAKGSMMSVVTDGVPAKAYALYASLPSSDGKEYFCIDSTGKTEQKAETKDTVTCP